MKARVRHTTENQMLLPRQESSPAQAMMLIHAWPSPAAGPVGRAACGSNQLQQQGEENLLALRVSSHLQGGMPQLAAALRTQP